MLPLLGLAILVHSLPGQKKLPADYQAYFDALQASPEDAIRVLQPVWTFRPTSPLIGKAALVAARAYLDMNRPAEALALLMQHRAKLPDREGEMVFGQAAEAADKPALAAEAYQRVFYGYPLSDEAEEAGGALTRLQASLGVQYPPPMPQAVFDRAEALRKSGQQTRAKRELLDAAARFAGRDREFALVRANHGDYQGLQALEVADAEAAAERLYLMHAAARRGSQEARAEQAMRQLDRDHPQSRWTMEALISWGNHHLIRNNVEEYSPLYKVCAERFANAYCSWKVAWAARMQRLPSADALMAEHRARFPEKNNEVDASLFTPTAEFRMRLERARLLDPEWAEFELKYAARESPYLAAMELAELANARGAHDQALRYIKGLAKGYLSLPFERVPMRFWRLAFPLPYKESIFAGSRSAGLDPYMVAALIRQESEFNPKAVSSAKAYGLTQVLPSTGRLLSRRAGVGSFRPAMLFDPVINVRLGTMYLRSMLDRNGGDWARTLAAYNAGQTRVNDWNSWYDYRDQKEFIETIPFTETRTYVNAVLRNAEFYRRLYGTGQ